MGAIRAASVVPRVDQRARAAPLVHRVDRYLLTKRVQRLFVISATVQARLAEVGRAEGPRCCTSPAPKRAYRCDEYGDYLFGVSRLTPLKRFDLVMRALAEPSAAGIRCVLAGEGREMDELLRLRRHFDLERRVTLLGASTIRPCCSIWRTAAPSYFRRVNEDYGFVTVEAFSCGKPVLTCHDSGGPAELVRDGVSGFVTDPTPEALAQAMRAVMTDRNVAIRLGEAGAKQAAAMTWDDAVQKLLIV